MYIYVGYIVNKGGRLVWRSKRVDSVRSRLSSASDIHKPTAKPFAIRLTRESTME